MPGPFPTERDLSWNILALATSRSVGESLRAVGVRHDEGPLEWNKSENRAFNKQRSGR